MEKIVKSNIAPNPKECTLWVDLSADAYGNVRKTFNGANWIAVNKQENSDLSDAIKALQNKVNALHNYDDTEILELISDLTDRIAALETSIVTEPAE